MRIQKLSIWLKKLRESLLKKQQRQKKARPLKFKLQKMKSGLIRQTVQMKVIQHQIANNQTHRLLQMARLRLLILLRIL